MLVKNGKIKWTESGIHLFFLLISILIALPFALVLSVSLTSNAELIKHGFEFIPKVFSLEAYKIIFKSPDILFRAYGVTILITVIGTALSLLLTAMTAYPISRRDYRYNRITTFYVFFTMLFNGGLVSFYILMTQYLYLRNTIWALILPLLLSPYNILIMKGFLDKIPLEVIESAKIDGARELRIFAVIIVPLSTPALATLGLFIAFGYWNDWFNALLFINNDTLVPLQLMLVRLLNQLDFLANSPMAVASQIVPVNFPSMPVRMGMAILAGGPMLIVFPFFQKYFAKGITVGSLKG